MLSPKDIPSQPMAFAHRNAPQAFAAFLAYNLRVVASALFFFSLDLTDFALCFVFAALDRLFGDRWGPCYCSCSKEVVSSIPEFELGCSGEGESEEFREKDFLLRGVGSGVEGSAGKEGLRISPSILDCSAKGSHLTDVSDEVSPRNRNARGQVFEDISAENAERSSCEHKHRGRETWEPMLYAESRLVSMRKQKLHLFSSPVVLPFSTSLKSLEPHSVQCQLRSNSNDAGEGSRRSQASRSLPDLRSHSEGSPQQQLYGVRRAVSMPAQSPDWRSGIRWTDCACPECSLPESNPKQSLFVTVIDERRQPGVLESLRTNISSNFPPVNMSSVCNSGGVASQASFGTCRKAGVTTGPLSQQTTPATEAFEQAPDVVFLHGFCSSSSFWADTVLPHFSADFRSSHRLLLVDLLGFGKSPKPKDCRFTVGEHAERIERDVLTAEGVRKFHLVAHSMGCTVALALAARNVETVASVTFFSPPFTVLSSPTASPSFEFFRHSAPRFLGPGMDSGISIVAWYEHVGRVLCSILNKGHTILEPLLLWALPKTRRIPPSFVRDFLRHTHHSAWHCYYNTICEGTNLYHMLLCHLEQAGQMVSIIHGEFDSLCPVEASRSLAAGHPNVLLEEVAGEDHVTVILGREADASRAIEKRVLSVNA